MNSALSSCLHCLAQRATASAAPHAHLVRLDAPLGAGWQIYNCSLCAGVFTQAFVQGTPRNLVWCRRESTDAVRPD